MAIILCIDDDRTGLALRKLSLEARGHSVLTATSGRAGIDIARRTNCDVVVLDFQMPHMDGAQVARALRIERPNLPIVLLSGSSEVPVPVLSMVNAYLEKGSPGSLDSLDGILKKLTILRLKTTA